MSGKKLPWTSGELQKILDKEFLEKTAVWGKKEAERAARALKVYKDVKCFLEETGWGKDNPEAASEEYLIGHRICRWVDGRFLYFSRLVWEAEEHRWI